MPNSAPCSGGGTSQVQSSCVRQGAPLSQRGLAKKDFSVQHYLLPSLPSSRGQDSFFSDFGSSNIHLLVTGLTNPLGPFHAKTFTSLVHFVQCTGRGGNQGPSQQLHLVRLEQLYYRRGGGIGI